MDPASVEAGRFSEESSGTVSEVEPDEDCTKKHYLCAVDPNRPIGTELIGDCHDDSTSVIRFVTNSGHTSTRLSRSSTGSSPPQSPAHLSQRGRSLSTDTDDLDQDTQPLNLSSGQRDREGCQRRTIPEKRGGGVNRKPKNLELLLTGSDLISVALNSPALPSGSITPAFFTTQVQHNTRAMTLQLFDRKN